MNGRINEHREAIVVVTVFNDRGRSQTIDALLDTGFSGALTLPPLLIQELNLARVGPGVGRLADGTRVPVQFYRATLTWDAGTRPVFVTALDDQPLLGMSLLHRHGVNMEVVEGGNVRITPL